MYERKMTNGKNDLQNITQKTKYYVTRTPLKTRDKLMCSERVRSSCSTSGTRVVNLVANPVTSDEWEKVSIAFTTNRTYM